MDSTLNLMAADFPPLFQFGTTRSVIGNRKIEGKVVKTSMMSKKTLEKLRRERMNICIGRLKDLICRHINEKERLNRSKRNHLWALHHKWEKADVIELGAELLEETLNRLTKNDLFFGASDENMETKTEQSSLSSIPPTALPTSSLPLAFIRVNQTEIWRPF